MSAPADVAGVFVRAEGQARLVTGLTADPSARQLLKDLADARNAFAELIEAVDRLTDSANPETQGWDEAVNALARVRGAK